MPAAFVQTNGDATGTTSTSVTFSSPTTSGNFIEVSVHQYGDDATAATFSVSDNMGNTSWASAVSQIGSFKGKIEKFYHPNIVGGSSHQITVSRSGGTGMGGNIKVVVSEYSGLEASTPLDKTASNTWTGTSADSGGTGTLSQAEELVTCCLNSVSGLVDFTAGGGYTENTEVDSAETLSDEYKTVNSTSSVSGTWTNSPSDDGMVILATYKATAGPPPGASMSQSGGLRSSMEVILRPAAFVPGLGR